MTTASMSVSCNSIPIFSGTEIWYGLAMLYSVKETVTGFMVPVSGTGFWSVSWAPMYDDRSCDLFCEYQPAVTSPGVGIG